MVGNLVMNLDFRKHLNPFQDPYLSDLQKESPRIVTSYRLVMDPAIGRECPQPTGSPGTDHWLLLHPLGSFVRDLVAM